MFCSNCGNKVREGSKFCSSCGTAIEPVEDIQPVVEHNESEKKVNAPVITVDTAAVHNEIQEEQYVPDDTMQKTFLSMKGRLNRLRYFKRTLALSLLSTLLCMIIDAALYDGEFVESILVLAFLYPQYCLDVRRLMDMDKESGLAKCKLGIGILGGLFMCVYGWEAFTAPKAYGVDARVIGIMGVAWLVGVAISLYLLFAGGTEGKNKYGPDPLAGRN